MNTNPKRAGVVIFIFRNKEGHFPVIKEWIFRKDIIIPNLYEPNNRALKYTKQNPGQMKEAKQKL